MNKTTYRQGELIFVKLDNFPKDFLPHYAIKKKSDNCIREGETTGHKHEVIGKGTLLEITQDNLWNITDKENNRYCLNDDNLGVDDVMSGDMFLTAENTIEIRHPEHKPLKLEKGDYFIKIQREYDEKRQRRISD